MTSDTKTRTLYHLARAFKSAIIGNNCPHTNAMRDRAMCPEIGDLVLETSHFGGGLGLEQMESAVGYLQERRTEEGEEVYVILDMNGTVRTWRNATMFTIIPLYGWRP